MSHTWTLNEVFDEFSDHGIMDTAYSYGNERQTNERFTGWTGYFTYDPRGSVSGVTDSKGVLWQSYRYDGFGNITFGKPQYNNVYGYNAESYNPNMDIQYLRARYYNPKTAGFLTEDSYLGDITDPLTLNRYNYVKSSPLNYEDPSGHIPARDLPGADPYMAILLDEADPYILDFLGEVADRSSGANRYPYDPGKASNSQNRYGASVTIREDGEDYLAWKMRAAEEAGVAGLCVRGTVRHSQMQVGTDSNTFRKLPAFLENAPEALRERLDEYMDYIYRGRTVPETEESVYIQRVVYGILADVTNGGYAYDEISNEYVDEVFAYYMLAQKDMDSTAVMLLDSLVMAGVYEGISQVGKGIQSGVVKNSQNRTQWFDNEGNPIWPSNRGFEGKPVTTTLQPGTRVDRYGYDGGTFVSPEGTPYSQRALAPGTENKPYTIFEVIKPVEVQKGKIASWFGEEGGGIQYEFSESIADLIEQGVLKKVGK